MSVEPEYIRIDDPFAFSCRPGITCFNQCCKDVNQFLYPYDIVRLKNHLGLHSMDFLRRYTVIYSGESTGLPVVSFQTSHSDGHTCPFVSDDGCSVYPNRPASCRIFPLARAISKSRQTGEIIEHFALIKDPICQGFNESTTITVKEYIKDQDLHEYNVQNDKMIELISAKQQIMPGVLDVSAKDKFVLACYNVDGFRDAVLSDRLIDPDTLPGDVLESFKTDDMAVLDLGLSWIAAELFGRSFPY